MEVTYYGQSCFVINIDGTKVLFDPFISPNELAQHIKIDDIEADYMLLTHGHEDHVADAEEILDKQSPKIVSNFEIVNWFADKGYEDAHPLNHGGAVDLEFGKVRFVNAIHSSILPDGSYGGNPGGFVIETDEGNFYNAGDTALTYDMKLIPERTDLDFAIFPIGDNFTMDVTDAIKASDFVDCNNIIGMHYDTFGFIEIDHDEAKRQFEEADKKLHLIDIGDSISM